jgi:hypothetical protein
MRAHLILQCLKLGTFLAVWIALLRSVWRSLSWPVGSPSRRLAASSIKQRGSVMSGRVINLVYRGLCRQYLNTLRR